MNLENMKYVDVLPSDDPAIVTKRMLEAVKPAVFVRGRCGAWSLILSHNDNVWIFSAKLLTPGSTEKDWEMLGRLGALVGAPNEVPSTITNAPNAAHKWIWGDK